MLVHQAQYIITWPVKVFQILWQLTLSHTKQKKKNFFLDSSKLKESKDNNLKFEENSRKFSKRVENTVRKGNIASYEQFVLSL